MLIASMDAPEIHNWIVNASDRAGSFLSHFALAALHADAANYAILRPVVMALRDKYPDYDLPASNV